MARITANEAGGQNVIAFLDMLAVSEGTAGHGDDGYNVNVGGQLFNGYADHPRIAVRTRFGWSDAAGRYQIMAAIPGRIRTDTWDWASKAVHATDFSPLSQDRVAIYLVARARAIESIKAGDLAGAVAKCAPVWASLPGSPYGQNTHAFSHIQAAYQAAGGTVA